MAKTILRSMNQDKAFHLLGLFCLVLLVKKTTALQFTVGGAKGWTVPDNSGANSYNQWAERTRFQIGDSLLFIYKPDQDSVLQVAKQSYDTCDTTNYINKYTDGHTVFTFKQNGPYYFISGNPDNCNKNEKLIIVVMADRSNRSPSTNQTTPAPAPTPSANQTSPAPAPAPAPTTNQTTSAPAPSPSTNQTSPASPPNPDTAGTAPSPAPSGEQSPPAGSVEINPTPSPVAAPHKNAASSTIVSFIGSVGALLFASSLVF
ncbi:hypothetical protein Tsubulata_003364 [Turnera subulata]|uniref:Phytocyanin domain-containing protein n=1 Tax=Turnera subulata TaxID=218843 RepID=A0A9Q0JMR0_9ROSI|nr:hypothetical protein Tsubulata_003364 [Turnera subulata]